jgi:hypothetical protein
MVCDIADQTNSNAYRSCNDPHSPIHTNKNSRRSPPHRFEQIGKLWDTIGNTLLSSEGSQRVNQSLCSTYLCCWEGVRLCQQPYLLLVTPITITPPVH